MEKSPEQKRESGHEALGLPSFVLAAANEQFNQLHSDKSNSDILHDIVTIPELSAKTVEILDREERADRWPLQDGDLKELIQQECKKRNIVLPDEDGLGRWFCLVYMASSILEEFSYGNVVRFEDIEKPPEQQREKTQEEESRERADFILGRLGLTMEDLRDKDVLDIGTGSDAQLALAAKQEGIDIIGVDAQKSEENVQEVQYVYSDFDNIPFENESFDLILSHAAPPLIAVHNKEDVKRKIEKAKRLLRPGGEFRFGPIGLTAEIFTDRELFTEEEDRDFTNKERIARVQERGFEFLQLIDPTIKEDKSVPDGFYVIKKL